MNSLRNFKAKVKFIQHRYMKKTYKMQKPLFPDFDPDLHKNSEEMIYTLNLMKQEGVTFEYITDQDRAINAVAKLRQMEKPLSLDTETAKLPEFIHHKQAGLEPHLSRIRLIQLYGGGNKIYIFDMDTLNIEVLEPIWNLPLVAHNAVFDIKHLLHAGVNPLQVGCTMLMANALSGKLPSLAALALSYLGWEMSKTQQISNWNAPKLTQGQLCYSALDVLAVFKLQNILKRQLIQKKLTRTYTLMRDAQHAIAKMELNGIFFDSHNHKELMDIWQRKKQEALKELFQILGPDVNPDSSMQISTWLKENLDIETLKTWPITKKGQLKTDSGTLELYPEHLLVTPLKKYKDATKLLSTFGTSYTEHKNPKTGRIHATFRLGGTATGRLSCYSPNIQNPPRDKAFRRLFSAPKGRILVVADYGQIELRIAALVSGDQNMIKAYAQGQDLHRKTAAAIAGVAFENITKKQRHAAKAVNFGLLYGQGFRGLARYAKTTYGVDMSNYDAKNARETFFKTYPGLRIWQQKTAQKAEQKKFTVTPCGRIRDFSKEVRGYQYTEALNTPIQGGAAEVLLAALIRLEKYLKGIDAQLVNIVHDEIVLESSKEDAENAKIALEKAMIEGVLAIFPDASTIGLVEAKIGINWAEAK